MKAPSPSNAPATLDGIEAWCVRAGLIALLALLSGCGGQVAEDPVERFVRAVCACGVGSGGCEANVRSEATGAKLECLTLWAEAYERTCSPNPLPACE